MDLRPYSLGSANKKVTHKLYIYFHKVCITEVKATTGSTTDMAKRNKKEELEERIVALRGNGTDYAQIAEMTSTPLQEVIDLSEKHSERVKMLRAAKMETLITTQRVDNRGRVEQLSSIQQRLREELERRDLSDIPTEKLVALLIRLSTALKDEVVYPKILSTYQQETQEMWGIKE
mgnify:CR=1 FL=1